MIYDAKIIEEDNFERIQKEPHEIVTQSNVNTSSVEDH